MKGSKKSAKSNQVIRLKMHSYDYRSLDRAVSDILKALRDAGSDIKHVGLVPLPTRVKRFTLGKSPNADKDARQQYELSTHCRLLDIDLGAASVDILMDLKLALPAGVDIELQS